MWTRLARTFIARSPAGWTSRRVVVAFAALALAGWATVMPTLLLSGRALWLQAGWESLDLAELLCLTATTFYAVHGDPRARVFGWAAAVLLVSDAAIDLSTASGAGVLPAVVMALCAELPLAGLCLLEARQLVSSR